ncbi:hypothetical protein T10_3187 [Trichinella papuae]|uniref:Uncharacterized protein n=1 Tax=Trichinella papuae TaxID=268474 RepID=A0A0V1LXQ5_9BILA|nr:hypothetical protein T10_2328 [Trichinella papuae]KRZ64925.1 hypothetical protein T10_3187 [Trichinella papuae]
MYMSFILNISRQKIPDARRYLMFDSSVFGMSHYNRQATAVPWNAH